MSEDAKKEGVIYALSNEAMPGLIKIGKTSRIDLEKRLKELYTTEVPLPFKCEYACLVDNMDEAEKALHAAFDIGGARINPKREFFNIDVQKNVLPIMKLLCKQEITVDVEKELQSEVSTEENLAVQTFISNKPIMNFAEMGIAIGEAITLNDEHFTPPISVKVTNVEHNKVKRDGEENEKTLSAITKEIYGYRVAPKSKPWVLSNGDTLLERYNATYEFTETDMVD